MKLLLFWLCLLKHFGKNNIDKLCDNLYIVQCIKIINNRYMEKFRNDALINASIIFFVIAFYFAFSLPKFYFILVVLMSFGMNLGIEALFVEEKDYPLASFMASLSILATVVLGYMQAHVAFTFIPSAITAGYITAAVTRGEDANMVIGALMSVLMFALIWMCNIVMFGSIM